MKLTSEIAGYAGFVGLATGLAIGTAPSAADVRDGIPSAAELAPRLDLDPFRGLTHAGMLLAARDASGKLEAGRPWAAWMALRDYLDDADDAPPAVALLGARAAAGWDGWGQVRRLLRGREWLSDEDGGAGLLLLGRAEEAAGDPAAAILAYRRFAAVGGGETRGVTSAHLGRVLGAAGRHAEAAAAFRAAAGDLPEVADWMAALQAGALAEAGFAATVGMPAGGSAAAHGHLAAAEARARQRAGDVAGGAARLEQEAHALAEEDAVAAAELTLQRARLLAAAGRQAEPRDALRRMAGDAGLPASVRARAAALLGGLPGGPAAEEELARADAYEAAAKPGLAAKALRSALRLGAADGAAARLRVGRLLFEAADYGPARSWLLDAAEKLRDPEQLAAAELYAARSLVRQGKADDGMEALRRVAERRAGTAAAGTAWFLLGDAAADRPTAIVLYRRAAATASPEAAEALFRAGDRSRREGDAAGALRAWEDYAARYPRGEQAAQAAYSAGLLHERAGRAERARALYAAAVAADPVAYYAVRAADRLGVDPLAAAIATPSALPATGDAAAVAATLRRLRLLDAAGLQEAWRAELDSHVRRTQGRPAALLALAEGLRDDGHGVEAIRLGRALLEARGGAWDERLLRVVFPLPYHELVLDEAGRAGVDPWLLAGLVRQESSFDRRARSWVGATGLSQIMPGTGRWLAPAAGVRSFDPALLTVPEINLRMGSRYLRDQLRRYGGARDLALAAYNAGPGRADRWKRELGYGRDVDAFREEIPFAETRHYVKVVMRNAEVYRRLYGPGRSAGLASPAR